MGFAGWPAEATEFFEGLAGFFHGLRKGVVPATWHFDTGEDGGQKTKMA